MTSDQKVIEGAVESAHILAAEVTASRYNCDCQRGGVDALSIDTDFLRHHVDAIREGLDVLVAAAGSTDISGADEFVQMRRVLGIVDDVTRKFTRPDHWAYDGKHEPTFLAHLIRGYIDPEAM